MTGADLDAFERDWAALASRWASLRTADEAAAGALLDRALRDGLTALVPRTAAPADVGPEVLLACEAAVIQRSGALDVDAYRAVNESLPAVRRDPLRHFTERGWRIPLNPSADFDSWWYWSEYLDPAEERVDPLLHYLLAGRWAGAQPVPSREVRAAAAPPSGPPRRLCLFAAHDVDGLVDDHVVGYLRELSRHADVYYLADGLVAAGELAKLADVTLGAWGVPHGRREFGSYAALADDLVGWDVVETYDELLLADDSCYLLGPLDGLLSAMDAIACDWWAPQASKRNFDREDGDRTRVPLAEALERWAGVPDADATNHLHVSSSFVAFRSTVTADPGFRRRLASARAQRRTGSAAVRYEVGLAHYLNARDFHLATRLDDVYRGDPLLTRDYLDLVRRGTPLLARALIADNPCRVPDLVGWKATIRAVASSAPVDVIERNLLRAAADDKLRASLAVRSLPDGSVDDPEPWDRDRFRVEDRWSPTFEHWWAFPVCAYDHTFAGNERAVFEEVRDDPSIKKIILTRSRRVEVTGANVVIVPLLSREGQHYLARSGQVFVKHGPRINAVWPLATTTHNVINLWHGIPLKRFGTAMLSSADATDPVIERNNRGCRAVVTSSRTDTLAMSTAFHPLSFPDMWPTGLPRNDFITRAEERLPDDLRAAERRLREEVGGRRLVLFLPTFKQGQDESYYHFDPAELEALASWSRENGAVLGVREHMADRAHTYSSMLAPIGAIDLSSRRYPDIEVLYRVSEALVSDYSSCLVDYLLTGRPVLSFAYDLDRYAHEERGLFYDLTRVLPGPVCRTFPELLDGLHDAFRERTPEEQEDYEWRRRLFFDHVDDQAAWRVVQRVKGLYLPSEDGPTRSSR